jgi:hypothetical protein
MNREAGPNQVFVCGACGKRSKDLHGTKALDKGWDVSCTLNAVLCKEDTLTYKNNKLVYAEVVEEDETVKAREAQQ